MRRASAVAVLGLTVLAGCGSNVSAPQDAQPQSASSSGFVAEEPSGGTRPTESSSKAETPIAKDEATALEPEQPQQVEGEDKQPLLGLGGPEAGGQQIDPAQIVDSMPADGTQVWGQDGCVWTVSQRYWMKTWLCRVPDANGNQTIFFIYANGTDPRSQWVEEVSTDPAVTGNGYYTVFLPRNGTNWMRCSTNCADVATWEVLGADNAWYTSDKWNAAQQGAAVAAQQAQQNAQQQGTTVLIGGDAAQILGAQGATGLDPAAFMQGITSIFNGGLAHTILAPACNSSYNGCG